MTLTMKNTSMKLEYIAEDSRGSAMSTGSLDLPSDSVENVTISGSKNGEIIYSVTDYDGQGTVFGMNEYTLTFDYYLQRHTSTGTHKIANSIEYYALTRTSGLLTPLTFYVHTDSNSSYRLTGGIINNFTITPEETRIKCSVEVIASSCTTNPTGDVYAGLNQPGTIGTNYEQFQGCTVTRSGSFEAGVSGFSASIANNAERIPVVGSSDPTAIYENLENLSGSVNILLNDGGDTDYDEFHVGTKQSIVFNTGSSTTATDCSMVFTFLNAHFSEVPITFNKDSNVVQSDISWKAETVTLAAKT